jgi:hypothetical protein
METRDRFDIALECSKCAALGTAQASEDDRAFTHHPDFRIDEFPPGFTLAKRARTRHETKVVCENCGNIITP